MQQAQTADWEVFDASKYAVGIAVSQFNHDFTGRLLQSALKTLRNYKVSETKTTVIRVAGSVELPLVLQKLARLKKFKCLIALGAVIRGETPHFEYVSKFVTEGILRVQLDEGIPIGFGILTCDTEEQAQARVKAGGGYAEAALQSAKVLEAL